jgi:hypothetical protein
MEENESVIQKALSLTAISAIDDTVVEGRFIQAANQTNRILQEDDKDLIFEYSMDKFENDEIILDVNFAHKDVVS